MRPMTVSVSTTLPCPLELAWQAVKTPVLLAEVAYPLVTFRNLERRPLGEQAHFWPQHDTVCVYSYLFGLIPLGKRTIVLEIDDNAYTIQTHERDLLAPRWDHLITMTADTEAADGEAADGEAADGERTLYRDEVVIAAGVLTPLVWAFAHWFYRHRQRRWQQVARLLAATQ